jgi:general secretion pathway protein G
VIKIESNIVKMRIKKSEKFPNAGETSKGFTLIELLVVMVILGLLATLVGPRMFGQIGASKVKTTKAQIEMLGAALDAYRLDMSKYPDTEVGLKALWEKPTDSVIAVEWRGPYLKKPVEKDPWGTPYAYKSPGEKADYELSSLGADAKPGGEGEASDINSWQ